ncbi:MAG: hypothetical protein RSH52_13755, partial [Janthinobacterium sp.]
MSSFRACIQSLHTICKAPYFCMVFEQCLTFCTTPCTNRVRRDKLPDEKKPHHCWRGFSLTANNKPDDNLLSHWLQHYHRRKVVS